MPAITESTKRKLLLLQPAEEFGNVSKACRIMGYHRDTPATSVCAMRYLYRLGVEIA